MDPQELPLVVNNETEIENQNQVNKRKESIASVTIDSIKKMTRRMSNVLANINNTQELQEAQRNSFVNEIVSDLKNRSSVTMGSITNGVIGSKSKSSFERFQWGPLIELGFKDYGLFLNFL